MGDFELSHLPKFDLTGQVAIVTGGGRGLGKWIAFGLAAAGANLVLASRTIEDCERVVKELKKNTNTEAIAVRADVRRVMDLSNMVDMAIKHFDRIDILVNNAGVNKNLGFQEVTEEDYDFIINTNLKGAYFCAKLVAEVMIARKKGRIINIASSAGKLVRAGLPNSLYSISKAGVIIMTKALAEELAKFNITVNAVGPGYFAEGMAKPMIVRPEVVAEVLKWTPLGRMGGYLDLIGPILFLASDLSNYITGQTIFVDGGRTVL
jgi:NAD(P)-dependent dehydrogenase (short-subunit alcohol dehydrogenase family)